MLFLLSFKPTKVGIIDKKFSFVLLLIVNLLIFV